MIRSSWKTAAHLVPPASAHLPWVLGMALLLGCTPGGEQKIQHAGPGRVQDKIIGASLAPPPGWERTMDQGGNRLIFVGPVHTKYRANVNLLATPDDGTPLDQLIPRIEDQLARTMPEWKKVGDGLTTLGGRPACFVSGDFRFGEHTLRLIQYTLKGSRGKTYTLTFAAPSEEFSDLEETLKRCANSLLVD